MALAAKARIPALLMTLLVGHGALAGALGLILAAYGLASGRWARGALFLGFGDS